MLRRLSWTPIGVALAIVAIAPRAAHAQPRPADPSRGLVAWYPLDGDAVDRITGARARETATRPADGYDGRPRGALWFDGARAAVDAGDALQPQRFTVSAWIRPEVVDRAQVIVSKVRNLPGDWQKNLELRLDPGGRLFLQIPSGKGWEGVGGQRPIAPGRWTHVAAVYDGQRAQLFVDGVRDGAPYAGTYLQSRTPIFLGARPESGGRDGRTPSGPTFFFAGAMEDVRIWDRPLLDPEIKLVAVPRPPQPPELPSPPGRPVPPLSGDEPVAWYPLDGDARDAVGDADGKVVGKVRPAEDRGGDPEGAVALGGRDYVDLGARVEPERFTIAAWVLPGRVDRDLVIFSKWSSAPGPRDRWLELRVDAGGRVALAIPGGAGGRPQQLRSTRALAAGRWAFLAATFDGGQAVLYVDGQPDAEGALQPFEPSRGPAFLGARPDSSGKRARVGTFFEGRLDDVRFYPGSLADAEIAALFQERGRDRPAPGPGPGPSPSPDDDGEAAAFLVKVDRLVARFDAAVGGRSASKLAQLEQRMVNELEAGERAARAERNGRIGGFIRRALNELQAARGRTDAVSLDRKRGALSGLAEALWSDLAQDLDDRPLGDGRGRDRGRDPREDDRGGNWY
jgi:hypothetical protein